MCQPQVSSITEYFLQQIVSIDNQFFNCAVDSTGAACAPEKNLTALMAETYRDLLHRNTSLADAARELRVAATQFNTTYSSEITRLMQLKDDLVESLASNVSIQQLGNTSARCLAVTPNFREPVNCACVGSSLVSNYSDPCEHAPMRVLTASIDDAAVPACGDIQPGGGAIPGSGNGSISAVLGACENVCDDDGEVSAPLIFGSIDYTVSKDLVDDVVKQLFPKGSESVYRTSVRAARDRSL